jgi:hypothetical protein
MQTSKTILYFYFVRKSKTIHYYQFGLEDWKLKKVPQRVKFISE